MSLIVMKCILTFYSLALPARLQEGLPRYASALLVSPSKGEDSFTDIRLDDPVYTTRPEGQPDTLAYRTFLQVISTPCIYFWACRMQFLKMNHARCWAYYAACKLLQAAARNAMKTMIAHAHQRLSEHVSM